MVWSIFPVGKVWESWDCLAWRMESLEKRSGGSYQCVQVPELRVHREQSQVHFSGAQWQDWSLEAMGTNWEVRGSLWTKRNTSSLWGEPSTDTGCLGRVESLTWRYWKNILTSFQTTISGWPCLSRGLGPDDLPLTCHFQPQPSHGSLKGTGAESLTPVVPKT